MPPERSYYKLLPQFRYLGWIDDELAAQVGIEHQVIVNTGVPAQIPGLMDLCVTKPYRRQKIATTLLKQIETLAKASQGCFILNDSFFELTRIRDFKLSIYESTIATSL